MSSSDSRKVQRIVFDVVQDPIPRDCKLPMELSRDILRNMFAERFGYSDLTPNDIDARPFAMTAWRSPQVAQLYKILHEVDFKQLLEVAEDGE